MKFLGNQPKIRKKPDGQPMVFGPDRPNINCFQLAFNPLRTVHRAILGNNSPIKLIKPPKKFPSKSAKNWQKALWLAYGLRWRQTKNELFPIGL